MSLVYLNGFDELSSPEKFWLNDANNAFFPEVPGRFGRGKALTAQAGGGNVYMHFPFINAGNSASSDGAIIGCAFKHRYDNWATFDFGSRIFSWYHWIGDARDYPAGWYETVRLGLDGNSRLYVGVYGQKIAVGKTPLLQNRYYYLEWKVSTAWSYGGGGLATVAAPASNTNEVRLDGRTEISWSDFTGNPGHTGCSSGSMTYVDVRGAASSQPPFLQALRLWYDNFKCLPTIDDLYVANTAGTANNDFLGDITVQNLQTLPGGTVAGGHDQWTLGAGSTKQMAVNELEPDCDISYVKSGHVPDIQTFKFGSIRTGPAYISGAVFRAVMRKNNIGGRKVALLVNGYTNNQDLKQPTDNYSVYPQGHDVNPATGVAWTESDLNSVEAGVQLVG